MSDESKEPTAAEVALVQPPAKGKLVPVLVGVNTLMMAGVIAIVLTKSGHSEARPAAAKEEAAEAASSEEHGGGEGSEHAKGAVGPPLTVKLDDFVVRLRNPEADRFARVSFEIEVAGEPAKACLTAAMARVRDGFIGELSDRTVEEMRGTDGLGTMKTALTRKLGELVPNCKVTALYVTDFIVQ